jgi:hypothetical protein
MARRTQTYAIRLAVEGGGQVKAELVSVGQSGEQSLKRIETAGGKASGGLRDLGRQAELLRAGIRTLGGALAGVTTVGGLAALVNSSISAAVGFAAVDVVAAAGLWLRAWWGAMAFLAAAVAQIVMYTFYSAIFGNHPGLVGFHLATIAIYGVLLIRARPRSLGS